jgi:hypothetical protein
MMSWKEYSWKPILEDLHKPKIYCNRVQYFDQLIDIKINNCKIEGQKKLSHSLIYSV